MSFRYCAVVIAAVVGVAMMDVAARGDAPSTAPATRVGAAPEVTARILQLTVSRPPVSNERELLPFSRGQGISIVLGFFATHGSIIELRGRNVSLTDEMGTDLFAGDPGASSFEVQCPGFANETSPSKNKRAVRVDLQSKTLPKPGAKRIRIKGEFVVVLGTQTQELPAAVVPLAKGGQFRVNDATFTAEVSGTRKGLKPGEEHWFIDLETHQPVPRLAAFRFFDEAGKEYDYDTVSGAAAWNHRHGEFSELRQYVFPKKLTSLKLIPLIWSRTHEQIISLDVESGLGLQRTGSNGPATHPAGNSGNAPATVPTTRRMNASHVLPATEPATWGSHLRVCGICIGHEIDDPDSRPGVLYETGTRMALYLQLPNENIVRYGGDAMKLGRFDDDRGTNLLAISPKVAQRAGFASHASISKDRHGILFNVESSWPPASAADSIYASGTLVLDVAKDRKQLVTDLVPVKEGEAFAIGDVHYTLMEVGKNDSIIPGFAFTLTTTDRDDVVESMEFRDEKDAVIEVKYGRSGQFGGAGHYSASRQIICPRQPAQVRLAASVWQDLRPITIPFQVETSLGVSATNQERGGKQPAPSN
jgi:hypothetical protein